MNRIQVIPDAFDPRRQIVSAFDFSPDFQLPAGKIYHAPRGINTAETLYQKGVTAISKYDLLYLNNEAQYNLMTAGKTYDDVPKTSEVLQLPDSGLDEWVGVYPNNYNKKYFPNGPLTYEQGRAKGSISNTGHYCQVYETEENYDFISRDFEMWRGYYENHMPRMRQRFDDRGIKSYVTHSYLNLGWPAPYTLGYATREESKAMLTKNISEMPFTQYSPGGTLGLNNLIVDAIYLTAPDATRKIIFENIFRLLVFKQMGKAAATFLAGTREWRPNNFFRTNYEDGGRIYIQDKPALSAIENSLYGFASMTFGDGIIGWGYNGKTNSRRFPTDYGVSRKYFPAGSSSEGPNPHIPNASDAKYYGYTGTADFVHCGVLAYGKTFGQTQGANKHWPDIKINGGAYRSGHVVDAYFDNQPMMYTERVGNKLAWCIMDPMSINTTKNLVWKDQYNVERSLDLYGAGLHCGIENI